MSVVVDQAFSSSLPQLHDSAYVSYKQNRDLQKLMLERDVSFKAKKKGLEQKGHHDDKGLWFDSFIKYSLSLLQIQCL